MMSAMADGCETTHPSTVPLRRSSSGLDLRRRRERVPRGAERLQLSQTRRVTAKRRRHRHREADLLLEGLRGQQLSLATVLALGAHRLRDDAVHEDALDDDLP